MSLKAAVAGVLTPLLVAGSAQAAGVTAAPFGVLKSGEAVEVFTLSNAHGMSVKVLSLGGIITELNVPDKAGRFGNVMLNLKDLAAYDARPNFSSLIGRVANRVSGGGFTLDGVRYPLAGSSGPNGMSSHGGPGGWGARVWTVTPFHDAKNAGLALTYVSADWENGYPGEVAVTVTYTLTDKNILRVEYTATTTRPTILNPTHHAYFNLAGGGVIDDHRLQVMAESITPLDERRLTSGQITDVAGTPFDLRKGARLGERLASSDPQLALGRGYDHNWVLAEKKGKLKMAARLFDPQSGRVLELATTEPGLQVYTANAFDGSLIDAAGRPLPARAGVALEPQHFPDSPNRPEFPSIVLRPGETFHSTTEYRFSAPKRTPAWARS
jgi:aldose 1-epimerase